jgi:broad specificity phosphatase PhoE
MTDINLHNTTIYFIRHGESEGNIQGLTAHDLPLTERGYEQAHALAQYFEQKGITPAKVITSTLTRAKETGRVIADAFNLEAESMHDLHERNWGVWSKDDWETIAPRLDSMTLDERYTFVPPMGESWQEMEERLLDALEAITQDTQGKTIVVVMHRGNLRALLPVLHGASRAKHEDFSIATGSIARYTPEEGVTFIPIS